MAGLDRTCLKTVAYDTQSIDDNWIVYSLHTSESEESGKEAQVGRALITLTLVCLLGAVAVGGELSGRVDSSFNLDPNRAIFNPQAALILEYSLSGWTFGMVGELGSYWTGAYALEPTSFDEIEYRTTGLEDVIFGARGSLGALHLASYLFFGNNLPVFSHALSCGSIALHQISTAFHQLGFLAWKNMMWTSIAGFIFG